MYASVALFYLIGDAKCYRLNYAHELEQIILCLKLLNLTVKVRNFEIIVLNRMGFV